MEVKKIEIFQQIVEDNYKENYQKIFIMQK